MAIAVRGDIFDWAREKNRLRPSDATTGRYNPGEKVYQDEMARYGQGLARWQTRYKQAMSLFQDAIGGAKGADLGDFERAADIYSPEGTFGAGQRAEIERYRKAGIASSFADLVKSGMWSGSTATGAQARYNTEAQNLLLNLEDMRMGRYSTALSTLGQAKLQRAGLTAGLQSTAGQVMAGAQEPTVGSYTSPAGTAWVGAQAQRYGSTRSAAATETSALFSMLGNIQSAGIGAAATKYGANLDYLAAMKNMELQGNLANLKAVS